jgi:hypothetical protein
MSTEAVVAAPAVRVRTRRRISRARIVAETLAENGAELAALQLVTRTSTPEFSVETEQGTISGVMKKTSAGFEINGVGRTSGVTQSSASVVLRGHVTGTTVWINYSLHP